MKGTLLHSPNRLNKNLNEIVPEEFPWGVALLKCEHQAQVAASNVTEAVQVLWAKRRVLLAKTIRASCAENERKISTCLASISTDKVTRWKCFPAISRPGSRPAINGCCCRRFERFERVSNGGKTLCICSHTVHILRKGFAPCSRMPKYDCRGFDLKRSVALAFVLCCCQDDYPLIVDKTAVHSHC